MISRFFHPGGRARRGRRGPGAVFFAVVLGACLAAVPAAPAREVAGVTFEETVRVADGHPELRLNGAGVRSKFFIKIYVGGLYLPQTTTSAAAALASAGPKRVRMHFLYDLSADRIRSAWLDGYRANHSEEEFARLRDRVEQFNALFPALASGDVVDVDFVPGEGTAVRINGETRGIVPGEDFYPATLKIWLGEKPASSGLKKAMLGEG